MRRMPMTQEIVKEQTQIAVETTKQEDYGDLIPDFAVQQMAKFFLTRLQEDSDTE